jgi:hypothetical protein
MATGRNVRMSLAWQSAWGLPADSSATAYTINAESGSAGPVGTQSPEERALMGLNGGAIDPISGPHDVSGSWSLPLCARQGGLWLHGLFGDVSSAAAVGSRGGYLFRAQAVAGDTITIGDDVLTFVATSPGAGDVLIGADVLATVENAATAAAALTDLGAAARGQILWIEHDTADPTGDTLATLSSAASRIQPYAATLKGGGMTKHVWGSEANTARPWASIEVDHTDASGSYRYRLVDSQMVRSVALQKQRSGQATMTVDVIARLDQRSASRTLTGSPTALAVSAFAFAGGSVLANGICIGTIDSAGVNMAVDLTADGFDACGVDGPGLIGQPIVGDTGAAFDLTGRFPATVLHDAAFGETPVAVTLDYVNSRTGEALFVSLPRVFLGRPSETYNARGVITAAFSGVGQIDPATGHRYAATLYSPTASFG